MKNAEKMIEEYHFYTSSIPQYHFQKPYRIGQYFLTLRFRHSSSSRDLRPMVRPGPERRSRPNQVFAELILGQPLFTGKENGRSIH